VGPVKNKLAQHKQKWLNHVSRSEDVRCPKHLPYYWRTGRRPGGPL